MNSLTDEVHEVLRLQSLPRGQHLSGYVLEHYGTTLEIHQQHRLQLDFRSLKTGTGYSILWLSIQLQYLSRKFYARVLDTTLPSVDD